MGIGWAKNVPKSLEILRNIYKIHTQTIHNGTHKGGLAAIGGRPTLVGTIINVLNFGTL